jgi:hypothetical protein
MTYTIEKYIKKLRIPGMVSRSVRVKGLEEAEE